MKKNSFGQGLVVFWVVIGIFYIIGAISEAREPKCIKSGCDNKQAKNSSYCYLHKPYTGSSSSHSSSSYSNKSSGSSSSQVVITINRHQAAIHHRTIAVQRKVLLEQAVQRKAIHITHMMMAMMIYIWMAIMIMIGMTGIVIMLMVWMMQWMSTEKIGKHCR